MATVLFADKFWDAFFMTWLEPCGLSGEIVNPVMAYRNEISTPEVTTYTYR